MNKPISEEECTECIDYEEKYHSLILDLRVASERERCLKNAMIHLMNYIALCDDGK